LFRPPRRGGRAAEHQGTGTVAARAPGGNAVPERRTWEGVKLSPRRPTRLRDPAPPGGAGEGVGRENP